MSVFHDSAVAVGATEVQPFAGVGPGKFNIWITNVGAVALKIGGKGVTSGAGNDGYPLAATTELSPHGTAVMNPENIYLISTGGGTTVDLLAIRSE